MPLASPLALWLAVLASLALASSATAAPADLDPLFGTGGIVASANTFSDTGVTDTVVLDGGKILVAGARNVYVGGQDYWLFRYNANGTPDTTFGGDGEVTLDFAGYNDYARDILLYDNGTFLVAGNSQISLGGDSQFSLAKFESDGDPDPTFGGGDGKTSLAVGVDDAYGYSVDVQSTGKIVVGGQADNNPSATDDDFALARFNANGTVDTTFGFDDPGSADPNVLIGWTTQSLEPYPNEKITQIFVDDDDKILAAGLTQSGLDFFFALARFNTNGFIDTTFSTNGHTRAPAISTYADIPYDAVRQADGKIVMVGETQWDAIPRTDKDIGVARFNTDGSLDGTLAVDGTTAVDFAGASDRGMGVAVDGCSNIVIAGEANSGIDSQQAVVRLSATGVPDVSFGTNGWFTNNPDAYIDSFQSVAIQPTDGMIVASGFNVNSSNGHKPYFTRQIGNGCAVPPTPLAPSPPVEPIIEARIASPTDGARLRRATVLKLAGSASSTGSPVAKVEIAVQRELKGKCYWLKSRYVRYRKSRKGSDPCAKSTWLDATGTTDWSYKFKRKLPRGKYRAYARVTLADGTVQQAFSSGENAIRFTIR